MLQEEQAPFQPPEIPSIGIRMIPFYGAARANQYRAEMKQYEQQVKLFDHMSDERDRLAQRSITYLDKLNTYFDKMTDAQQRAAVATGPSKQAFEQIAARSQLMIDSLMQAAKSDKDSEDSISAALARFTAQSQPPEDFGGESFERPQMALPGDKAEMQGPQGMQQAAQPAMGDEERMAIGAEMGIPEAKAGMKLKEAADKQGLDWKKEQHESYEKIRSDIKKWQFKQKGLSVKELGGMSDAMAATALSTIASDEDAPEMMRGLAAAAQNFTPAEKRKVIQQIQAQYGDIIKSLRDDLDEAEPGHRAYMKLGEDAGVAPLPKQDRKILSVIREKYGYEGSASPDEMKEFLSTLSAEDWEAVMLEATGGDAGK